MGEMQASFAFGVWSKLLQRKAAFAQKLTTDFAEQEVPNPDYPD